MLCDLGPAPFPLWASESGQEGPSDPLGSDPNDSKTGRKRGRLTVPSGWASWGRRWQELFSGIRRGSQVFLQKIPVFLLPREYRALGIRAPPTHTIIARGSQPRKAGWLPGHNSHCESRAAAAQRSWCWVRGHTARRQQRPFWNPSPARGWLLRGATARSRMLLEPDRSGSHPSAAPRRLGGRA